MGFHDHYYATTYDATDVSQAAIEQEEDEEEDKPRNHRNHVQFKIASNHLYEVNGHLTSFYVIRACIIKITHHV